MSTLLNSYSTEIATRLRSIEEQARMGGLEPAIEVIVTSIESGGVLQAFGTGHSEAFAMEIAGRAGGFIPSHAIGLRDLVLLGEREASILGGAELERDDSVVDELWSLYDIHPADAFLIASNSGVNGTIVGLALKAKAQGHPVIAVTSLEHTNAVKPKHPSGKRLSDIADVVLDNCAPYGDATLDLGDGLRIGPVSSITAAYIAQLLTIGAVEHIRASGAVPPMYVSANIPGGDEHNNGLESRYGARVKPFARLRTPDAVTVAPPAPDRHRAG